MPRRISTVCGREFGDGVRAALARAGLTHRDACAFLNWDEAKLSDMVNGKGGVTEPEVTNLLGLCRVPHQERDRLLVLFHEARGKGWLQFPESGVPDQVRTLVEHERLAVGYTAWCMNLIPGLLQIPEYTREVVLAGVTVQPDEVDELLAARIARRAILRSGRQFTFYVHEQALRLSTRDTDVMSDQLHELLRLSVRPYISLRIVPLGFGFHAGLAGSFVRLTFEKFEPLVFVESHNSSLFLDDKDSLAVYRDVLESLDRQALDEEQSRGLITTLVT